MGYIMMMAHRLYRHSGDVKRVSRPAILIATAGIAVGLAIMLISISVVFGFKGEIQNKVIGFGGHVQVENYDSKYQGQALPICVDDSMMQLLKSLPNVKHVQRYARKSGMVKTEEAFRGVVLQGVGQEYSLDFLRDHLVDGTLDTFTDSCGHMLVSKTIADELCLKVGDRPYVYFLDNGIRVRRLTISGIYCTHLSEFDNQLLFTDAYTVQRLHGWERDQYSVAELDVTDTKNIGPLSKSVVDKIHHTQDKYGAFYTSATIWELYPSIFSWLSLLDTDVIIILILMTCVTGVTMVSGLLIIILERANFIGVMKAMGATNSSLRRIFINFAAMIILRGMFWGNLVALVLICLQHFFPVVKLDPETYYVESVPMAFPWMYFLLVNVVSFVVSILSMIVPSFIVSSIHPARSIRFE